MFGMMIGMAAVLFIAIPAVVFAGIMLVAVLGAVFSGAAVLFAAGVYAGEGILLGMVIGFIAYRAFRKSRMAEKAE